MANRKFKRPFSLSATISPAQHTVNRTVSGKNFALAMTISSRSARNRFTSTQFDRFAQVRAELDGRRFCITVLDLSSQSLQVDRDGPLWGNVVSDRNWPRVRIAHYLRSSRSSPMRKIRLRLSTKDSVMEVMEKREAWNKDKLIGQKPPAKAEGHLGDSNSSSERACSSRSGHVQLGHRQ